MSHQSNLQEKGGLFIAIAALFLIVLGFSVFAGFDEAQKLLLHLSPDRSFMPITVLTLRSSFLSFGLVGICLVFFLLLRREVLKNALRRLADIKESHFLLLSLGLALILRIAWITLVPTQLYSDWKCYDEMAHHMSQVWRYEENGVPTAYQPVGYPFFLAIIYWIFGHRYLVVEFINVLLSLGTCVFTYLVAKRLASPVCSRLTLLILALFPSQIFFTSLLASEILFTFLLFVVVYFSLKHEAYPRMYLSVFLGLLLGLLILVRAVALILPVVIALFYFKSAGRTGVILRNAIIMMVVAFLTLLPWMLRNKLTLGTFTVATSGGINLYIGNNPISTGSWVWQEENPFKGPSAPNEVENDRLGYRLATRFIMDDPLGFIWRGVKKEIYLFVTDFSALSAELNLAAQSKRVDKFVVFAVIAQVYYLIILVFAAGGLLLYLKGGWGRRPGFYLLWGILIYWMGIHFIFFGIDRFHFPLIPILSILASGFLVSRLSPSLEHWSKNG